MACFIYYVTVGCIFILPLRTEYTAVQYPPLTGFFAWFAILIYFTRGYRSFEIHVVYGPDFLRRFSFSRCIRFYARSKLGYIFWELLRFEWAPFFFLDLYRSRNTKNNFTCEGRRRYKGMNSLKRVINCYLPFRTEQMNLEF